MVDRSYSRRRFIQAAGLAAGAALAAPLPERGAGGAFAVKPQPISTQLFGRQYQGTSDGFIYESADGGLTWQQVAKFGKHCAILALNEYQGLAYAQVGVGSHQFVLTSTDARRWRAAQATRA